MVNTILAKRVNHIVAKGGNPVWPKGSKSRGFSTYSLGASQEAFKRMKGDNKELMIIPGASHTDLYDRMDIIPFNKIEVFFKNYLR